ncbi:hypothetical protein [Hymenobacter psychrophilus]|uniref:Uncharacterized protein n=1 Tax=Hymenobacter psychrophilus TaxID=651662 RepID=A0A1H3DEP2_9BACT|nr:hypothetical protein [Hymenobacter psychrophilus]SDX64895.1 hypothetical protein SAMN04488069_102332 [Hymenobacter psychrophilus]
MPNQFSQDIPAAALKQAQTALDDFRTAIEQYLHALTPDERRTMLRMADKTVAFVQKTADYAANTPAFVPTFVSVPELTQDLKGVQQLTPLYQQLAQLTELMDSTVMLAGSEAYGAALTIYKNIKFMAENKQPGAQTAYDDLKQRFPGRSVATPRPDRS